MVKVPGSFRYDTRSSGSSWPGGYFALKTPFSVQNEFQHSLSMLETGSLDIAIQKLQLLSREGDGHADGALGAIYEWGIGHIKPDISRALSLYEKSVAKVNSVESWLGIGRILLCGPPEMRDYSRAYDCFIFLAEQCNNAAAWLSLGEINLTGLGRHIDLDEAERSFRAATDLGSILGYSGLAKVEFERGRTILSLRYRVIGAIKGFKEPDGSDALKRW